MSARAPEDCDRLFQEHLNAGQLDALVALYEPTATLVTLGSGPVTGHDEIRRVLGELVRFGAKIRMNVVKMVRGGDDLALLTNEWSMQTAGPDRMPANLTGRAIEVVRRQPDGTWRFVIDDPAGGGA